MHKEHLKILTPDNRYQIIATTDFFEPAVYHVWLFATEKYPNQKALAELKISSSGELLEAIEDSLSLHDTYKVGSLICIK